MQGTQIWVFGIGLLAQLLFSARVLYQWIVTEKAKEVLSPPAFWVLSIVGSYLLFIYGVLRNDFSIILGQFLSYYVYLWNLNMQGLWKKITNIVKVILLLTPVAATA
ncbi:MAG TPA: lipid-A-disaccharide synthase N-terminal domain-containing protein, partial [Dysgonamonadaceae bacterium]|nr:lipid-A-disaccharide synthase N-terminal domain-containing protein [Dysgonamonadaceae bacterium]